MVHEEAADSDPQQIQTQKTPGSLRYPQVQTEEVEYLERPWGQLKLSLVYFVKRHLVPEKTDRQGEIWTNESKSVFVSNKRRCAAFNISVRDNNLKV